MGIVKTFGQAVKKYATKYSGANVTARLTELGSLVEENYETGVSVTYNAVGIAKNILANLGVPPGHWGYYIAFAEEVARYSVHYGGQTLQIRISAIMSDFVTAYQADPSVLTQIAQAVVGVAPPY